MVTSILRGSTDFLKRAVPGMASLQATPVPSPVAVPGGQLAVADGSGDQTGSAAPSTSVGDAAGESSSSDSDD